MAGYIGTKAALLSTTTASVGGDSTVGGDLTVSGLVTASDGAVIDNDGATVLTVDRATSDGTIIDVQKDGSTVGSIGVEGGDLYIGTGDTQLRFKDGDDEIRPASTDGATRDAAIDLGAAAGRFKNLYLSGGVYLGGTGASNHLDDYEEGTWTPASPDLTLTLNGNTRYTKIGQVVYCEIDVSFPSSSSGSDVRLSGLPFTPLSYGSGTIGWNEFSFPAFFHVGTYLYVMRNDSTSRHAFYAHVSGDRMIGSFMYTTNS